MSKTERSYRIQAEIGRLLHIVNYRWHRCVVTGQEKAGMDQETIVNGRILGYLSMEKNDVYQKDLEKVIHREKTFPRRCPSRQPLLPTLLPTLWLVPMRLAEIPVFALFTSENLPHYTQPYSSSIQNLGCLPSVGEDGD